MPPPNPTLFVIAAILHASLCVGCIARKTDLTAGGVKRRLAEIGEAMKITASEARCDICQEPRTLYRVV